MTALLPLAGAAWLDAPESRRVLDALEAGGREARFVGGCVRDRLLGRADARPDLDIATQERPERVLELLKTRGIRAIPTGLAHGTVTAVLGEHTFEITTLRRDVACDGRHAEVAFTDDFRLDAARRDFTINAMSCDRHGQLFDYFGGKADLAAGRIRFVGDPSTRIAEDHLRSLRYFRFFALYGRAPADEEALSAMSAAASGIDGLSGERVQSEMLKLLAAPDPGPALRLMEDAGLLGWVLFGPVAHERLAELLLVAPEADPVLRLACLLRPPPASPETAARVADRWRLARRDAERLKLLVSADLPALTAEAGARRRQLYRLGKEVFADLARLAAAEDFPHTPERLRAALADADAWTPPVLPVSGEDVLRLGVPPGPRVGELLRGVEAWWLERDFAPDRWACLAWLRAQNGSGEDG